MGLQTKGLNGVQVFLDTFEKNTGIPIVSAVKKHGLDLYRSIVYRSPVDTGDFRRKWAFSVSTGGKFIVQFNIFNPLPYALPLVIGSPVGGKPWASEGPKTVERAGRIWSKQSPEDLTEKAVEDYPIDGLVKEIERALFRE